MIIGIDPGLGGALAFLSDSLELINLVDMPVMNLRKGRKQVNAVQLAKEIKSVFTEGVCYLESVSSMPKQGVSSVFSFGMSYGIVQGVLGALQIPIILVTPTSWKKRANLLGKDKEASLTLAQQLYPQASLARKKDHGRAEAILIARFGGDRR